MSRIDRIEGALKSRRFKEVTALAPVRGLGRARNGTTSSGRDPPAPRSPRWRSSGPFAYAWLSGRRLPLRGLRAPRAAAREEGAAQASTAPPARHAARGGPVVGTRGRCSGAGAVDCVGRLGAAGRQIVRSGLGVPSPDLRQVDSIRRRAPGGGRRLPSGAARERRPDRQRARHGPRREIDAARDQHGHAAGARRRDARGRVLDRHRRFWRQFAVAEGRGGRPGGPASCTALPAP